MNFTSANPRQVLAIYAELSGMELITASHVNRVASPVTLHPKVTLTKLEMIKLIEKALLDQSGIVITKLDSKRVSVTYNDALPLIVGTSQTPVPASIRRDSAPIPAPRLSLSPTTPAQK